MSLLELGGNKFTIPVGEVALGSDASCAISLSGSGILPRHAVLQGQADGQVIIRKASPAADVLINGVRLEAGSDVVVVGKDVSRRHAEIVQTPKGYLLVDSSTNGSFVNDERVEGQRILARADVIRIGEEQFRFYADAAPAAGPPPPPQGPAASAPQAAPPASPTPPPPLASFLVRSGALIGQRLQVKTPVANIGRADSNDPVIPHPSVSTSHAKT